MSNFNSVFFFKQKTAYEMRISDWSSDVCSSDLIDDGMRAWQSRALNQEDKGIVEAIQARRDYVDRHGLRPAMLACDEAAVRVAREIDRLEKLGRASCRERVCQ